MRSSKIVLSNFEPLPCAPKYSGSHMSVTDVGGVALPVDPSAGYINERWSRILSLCETYKATPSWGILSLCETCKV
jgi:hypothetical protein